MSDQERNKADSFKVTDRRSFTSEGELRPERQGTAGAAEEAEPESPKNEPPPAAKPDREAPPQDSRPAMEFSSFILSLATTALVHLGEMADPAGGRSRVNLDAARQMVDILAMLMEKTEGNRSPEETRLLDDILYELRMKILSKTRSIKL